MAEALLHILRPSFLPTSPPQRYQFGSRFFLPIPLPRLRPSPLSSSYRPYAGSAVYHRRFSVVKAVQSNFLKVHFRRKRLRLRQQLAASAREGEEVGWPEIGWWWAYVRTLCQCFVGLGADAAGEVSGSSPVAMQRSDEKATWPQRRKKKANLRPAARLVVIGALIVATLFLLKTFVSIAIFVLAMMGFIYFLFITFNKDEGSGGGKGEPLSEEETLEEARKIMEKYK
ncbi:hypothetical protein AXF42_Ash007069 [Apostasia shenzhenica]|uniref:Uncharacterized protein n=1 Tax=Apostasia shenzhenica TaxID=1088818 RepID=A0A2I0BF22_9ASPA|nr:hypothetical protein AXF42_Ash007069 [Apostasia shenzhenica]